MRSALIMTMATLTLATGVVSGDVKRRAVIVNTPEVLNKMGTFAVFADADPSALAVGVDGRALQRIAIKMLKDAGLPVVSSDEAIKTDGKVSLTIYVSIAGEAGLIRLAVQEMVELRRDPNCEVIGAATYSDQFFGLHKEDPEVLAEAYERLIRKFITTYRQQNQ